MISSGQQLAKSDSESGDEQDRLDEELFTIESESSDGSSVEVDNTDEDPDYDPSHLDHLSSEDEQSSTSTCRPRGRPPTVRPGTSVQNRPTPSRRLAQQLLMKMFIIGL